jgi:hypothetical protein
VSDARRGGFSVCHHACKPTVSLRGRSPSVFDLLVIGVCAFVLRVTVFLVITRGLGFSFQAYTEAADGRSYQNYARAILGDRADLTEYDARVFPGYPALIAGTSLVTRLPVAVSGLLVTWIAASLAAMFSAMLFRDRRIGWAMVMFIPHWPINSSLVMAEAPMLALATGGLIVGLNEKATAARALLAGTLLGAAALVKPAACFALAGLVVACWMGRRRALAGFIAVAAAIVVLAGSAGVRHITGSALFGAAVYSQNPSAYGGRIFGWPFEALIETVVRAHPPVGRVGYVWAHVLLVLVACGILAGRLLRGKPAAGERLLNVSAFCWIVGNSLFTLCIGSGPFGWGFYHFPRFTIPAMPAAFWAIRRVWPSKTWIWVCIAVVMTSVAVAGVRDALTTQPLPRIFVPVR